MSCNKGALSAHEGVCSSCGMKLLQVRDGQMEHTDHNPKHGGTFFMAPDGWHHLEGSLVRSAPASPSYFELHLYDNFTQSIPSEFAATAEFTRLGKDGAPTGESKTIKLTTSKSAHPYIGSVPPGISTPLAVCVKIWFKPDEKPAQFDFKFSEAISRASFYFNPDSTWAAAE